MPTIDETVQGIVNALEMLDVAPFPAVTGIVEDR